MFTSRSYWVIVQTSGQLIPGLSIFGDLDRGRLRVAVEGVAVDDKVHAIGIARVIFNIGLVPFAVPQGILDVAAAGTKETPVEENPPRTLGVLPAVVLPSV